MTISNAGALETKSAVQSFLNEFNAFQEEMKMRFQRQEERIEALDRKSAVAARPALSRAAEAEPAHKKALSAYLRTGEDDGLRGLEIERKGLTTAVNAEGGYLVDPQTAERIQSVLTGAGSLRAVANVVQVEANSFDVLVDRGDVGSGWATETDPAAETGSAQIERISIPLHELSAMPKASQRLLDDAAFDIEGWLAGRIADKFARAESVAFISGDGVNKPRGILSYPTAPNGTETWGQIGYVTTNEVGDFSSVNPADAIVDLVYALGAQYRAKAVFVMNSKTAGAVRKMKDADGRFLWADSLAAGEPSRLMGYPVVICEDMPDATAGGYAIAFGDFGAGYTIAERPDLRILRDPFSQKPHVLFYATKRVGGDVTDFSAIKLLKFDIA
ncbi:phage major capsid protein [Oceanicella actignis]|uniref:Phage major capsid protein, HK97 family n=1 Tax=Oceanicella actignis TaxID=1189325 RepID=A0A1M7TZR0_9RHOB|nr:phage major capsid protein [Oceanicella actignis]TYO85052.1 HK97 family phage major capsid protein [Oceanicella actignis]SET83396.1 phage major capsid protein, HK97 family [Oceanicella actignis]SHN76185.1 phage major capsid protein, HK97 family [Oceanicella actignis]